MEQIVLGGKALSIVSTLGVDVIIKGIQLTTLSIISGVKYLVSIHEFAPEIKPLDLEFKLAIISAFIEDIQENKKEMNKSTKLALASVGKVLEKINVELQLIKNNIRYHKSKWFSSWRTCDVKDKVKQIIMHTELLDERFNFLIKIMTIIK